MNDSMNDQERWDKRYLEGAYSERLHPSAWLVAWQEKQRPPTGLQAADIACGRGRNAIYLAAQGYSVDGYDVSGEGLRLAAETAGDADIRWQQRDLIADGLPPECQYDLIIVFRFLCLDLIRAAHRHLRPGGFLLAETHLQIAQAPESLGGPKSQRFRVASGALRDNASELQIVEYDEGLVEDPDGSTMALARLIGRHSG